MTKKDLVTLIQQTRSVLEEALSKLSVIEERASEFKTVVEPPEQLVPKLKVLKKVKDEGGTIGKEELREFWSSLGKDPRGFGGLFQGHAKLVLIAGNKVALSPEAEELLKRYEKWLDKETSETEVASNK